MKPRMTASGAYVFVPHCLSEHELYVALHKHMSEKNMQLLRNVTTHFGNSATLKRITEQDIFADDFGKIANSLRAMYRL